MTLIEVVAGLALMASVLSGIFVIKARTVRQARVTERRQEAVDSADALIASWWQDADTFPRSGAGPVPAHPDLAWRTSLVRNPQAEALGGQVVRVEIIDQTVAGPRVAIAAVELALPLLRKADEPGLHPH